MADQVEMEHDGGHIYYISTNSALTMLSMLPYNTITMYNMFSTYLQTNYLFIIYLKKSILNK